MGWIVIDHGKDQNTYRAFESKEDAKKEFIRAAKIIGTMLEDPEAEANDEDDWDELAEGGIYSPNGNLEVEIDHCDIYVGQEYV